MSDRIVIVLTPNLVAYAYPGCRCPIVHRAEGIDANETAQAAARYILPLAMVVREVNVAEGIVLLDVSYGKIASGTVLIIAPDEMSMPLDT